MHVRRGGFSLVELLTVIAIIVLLAAIMLPVFGRAQEESRRTECMTNLHNIAVAIKLFRLDERQFPKDLVERPIGSDPAVPNTVPRWFGPADPQTGRPTKASPGYGLASLYPDYIQTIKTFNCPNNPVRTINAGGDPPVTATEAADPTRVSYQSYDGWDILLGELKYARNWRAGPAPGTSDIHYRRQLYWLYPPEDTVVTWCSSHREDPGSPQATPNDRDIVVYLDGTVDKVPSWDPSLPPELQSGHRCTPEETP